MNLPTDLRAFIALLNSTGVKYVIVGGYAVAFHGQPRFTGDIDVFLEPSAQNAARVMETLTTFGFGALSLTAADFTGPDIVVQLGYPPNRIDLLTSIDAVTFSDAFSTAVPAIIDGVSTQFISKELLKKNKSATGRAKDAADAQML